MTRSASSSPRRRSRLKAAICRASVLAFAFELEEGKAGQFTYMRIYSHTPAHRLQLQAVGYDMSGEKRMMEPRPVKMEEVDEEGKAAAIFDIGCAIYTPSETNSSSKFTLSSLNLPELVMPLAVTPNNSKKQVASFSKALTTCFQKEDTTLQ